MVYVADQIGAAFEDAVELISRAEGHVVVLGVGTSGTVSRQLVSTLARAGTPSFFVDATEALHGDLGMITARDTVMLVSDSGETKEMIRLLPHLAYLSTPIVALVGNQRSTLADAADVAIELSTRHEAAPAGLLSAVFMLSAIGVGEALAAALREERERNLDGRRPRRRVL